MKQYENPETTILDVENCGDLLADTSVTEANPDENYYPTWRK